MRQVHLKSLVCHCLSNFQSWHTKLGWLTLTLWLSPAPSCLTFSAPSRRQQKSPSQTPGLGQGGSVPGQDGGSGLVLAFFPSLLTRSPFPFFPHSPPKNVSSLIRCFLRCMVWFVGANGCCSLGAWEGRESGTGCRIVAKRGEPDGVTLWRSCEEQRRLLLVQPWWFEPSEETLVVFPETFLDAELPTSTS